MAMLSTLSLRALLDWIHTAESEAEEDKVDSVVPLRSPRCWQSTPPSRLTWWEPNWDHKAFKEAKKHYLTQYVEQMEVERKMGSLWTNGFPSLKLTLWKGSEIPYIHGIYQWFPSATAGFVAICLATQNLLRSFLKIWVLGAHLWKIWISGSRWAQEFVLLTSSQGIIMGSQDWETLL